VWVVLAYLVRDSVRLTEAPTQVYTGYTVSYGKRMTWKWSWSKLTFMAEWDAHILLNL